METGAIKKTIDELCKPNGISIGPTRSNIYVDFYNSKNGFKQERKYFETYEQAVRFLQTDFDKFDLDMIHFDLI
jgi:hypothetical protein